MKKYEEDFFKEMDSIISSNFKTKEDQDMLAFSKHFMNKLQVINLDGIKIQFEPMDVKLFQYFILSIIVSWQENIQSPGIENYGTKTNNMKITEGRMRRLKKVDEIFPTKNRTIKETRFLEQCLDKMKVDLEFGDNEDFIISTQQLVFLLTGIIKAWNIFEEKSSNN